MEFDRKVCDQISNEVQESVRQLFKDKYPEMEVTKGSGSYGPQEFTMKIVFSCPNQEGETKPESDYKKWMQILKMPEGMLNATFNHMGQTIRVIGYMPNRPKNDLLFTANGKEFVGRHTGIVRSYELELEAGRVSYGSKPSLTNSADRSR